MIAAGCGGSFEPIGSAASDPPGSQPAEVVAAAEQQLGGSFAGGFVDQAGDVVVFTTDPAETYEVRALGAKPQVVQYSLAELENWKERVGVALGPQPPPTVTAWGVDVQRNAVVVSVLPGEPVPARLQQVVDEAAGRVVLTEARGPVVPLPGP
ncbi:MAG: S1 family peptidase [Actinomycetota bacterium]|nr:S1 family peptidase [Actinomycetota bacterium]